MNITLAPKKHWDQQERWKPYLLCSGGRPFYYAFLTRIRNIRLQCRKIWHIQYISNAHCTWVYERGVHVYGICKNAAVDVPDFLRTLVSSVAGYGPGSTNLSLISCRIVGRQGQSRGENKVVDYVGWRRITSAYHWYYQRLN